MPAPDEPGYELVALGMTSGIYEDGCREAAAKTLGFDNSITLLLYFTSPEGVLGKPTNITERGPVGSFVPTPQSPRPEAFDLIEFTGPQPHHQPPKGVR